MNMIYFIYQIISFYIISFYFKKYLNIKDKIIENPCKTEIYQDKSVVIACEKRASCFFWCESIPDTYNYHALIRPNCLEF